MKKSILFLSLILTLNNSFGQIIPSNCNPSDELLDQYALDIKNLALRRMWEVKSPDTAMVAIPQQWIDTVAGGLAAICNAVSFPERDSVFNMYCVHDRALSSLFITHEIMVFVDTSYAWTDAWQNLEPLTGNPQIDELVTNYNLEVVDFQYYSFGNMALLSSDSLWNVYALIDNLEMVEGVDFGEPNQILGAAGKIFYNKTGYERLYSFWFQWNDCFDGCDNAHVWHFKVYEDCSVEFLGAEDWGVFEILLLPDPINCNIFSRISNYTVSWQDFSVFPNPAEDNITILSKNKKLIDLAIYSFTGELIMKQNFIAQLNLDLAAIPPGIYLLHFSDENGDRSIHKIMKK
jgi:hypothetical protein